MIRLNHEPSKKRIFFQKVFLFIIIINCGPRTDVEAATTAKATTKTTSTTLTTKSTTTTLSTTTTTTSTSTLSTITTATLINITATDVKILDLIQTNTYNTLDKIIRNTYQLLTYYPNEIIYVDYGDSSIVHSVDIVSSK